MKEVKTIILDDGIEYYLADEVKIENDTYYFLTNMQDNKDLCVRKKEMVDGEEYLCTLDSIDELNKALTALKSKHQK